MTENTEIQTKVLLSEHAHPGRTYKPGIRLLNVGGNGKSSPGKLTGLA
jgi:hypothetical protein